jgi:hypothetical protein
LLTALRWWVGLRHNQGLHEREICLLELTIN